MRGFKRDVPLTKVLRANGLLLDRRSFIGYDPQMIPHLLLKGDDVIVQRQRVWHRAKRLCGICGGKIDVFDEWELDHKKGGSFGRCDCLHNLQPVHKSCHREKHVAVKFKRGGSEDEYYS